MDDSSLKKHEKPPNPRATANPLSALTFSWILGLFWVGHKRELEITDLYTPLKEHSASYLGNKFERIWNSELKKCDKNNKMGPSLLHVIRKALGAEIMMYGVLLAVVEIFMKSAQPLFLGRLIRYFSQDPSSNEKINLDNNTLSSNFTLHNNESYVSLTEAYVSALGVIFCASLQVIIEHPYIMAVIHIGMKIHVGCVSLIYRKVLKLSKTALGETTVGEIVNLLSNDVSRFDYSILFLHYLWVGPLQTVVITYFLWKEVGFAAILGVLTLLAFIPMQVWLGKKNSILRLKTAIKTDKRLRLMNEIISGLQVIKMYTWEKPFANLVSVARRKEMDVILKTSYIRSVLLSFFLFHTRVAIFISILYYVLEGNYINAEKIFVVTCFYNILRVNMTLFFPQAIALLAEAMVSVKRLQKFMMYGELINSNSKKSDDEGGEFQTKINGINTEVKKDLMKNVRSEGNHYEYDFDSAFSITMSNVTAKWSTESTDVTLDDINLDVSEGKLVTIIGLVGSGKSSLLQAILQELTIESGILKVNGIISYASQEPWLFAGSVRQNILFGEPYDRDRYRDVTRACALRTDFAQMPYGDKTIVSDRGVSLSGGQRARINLARAIYKRADVYLLDDPLSAVDTHVGKHLFEDCIMGYLQNKTRVLVTHQIQYLTNLEHIVMLENGRIICNGNYQTLLTTGKYFAELLKASQNDSEVDNENEIHLLKRRFSQQSTASSFEGGVQEEPPEMAEMRAFGSVSLKVYKDYFKTSGSCLMLFFCFLLCISTQFLASYSDYWITFWVNLEEEIFSVDFELSTYESNNTNISVFTRAHNNQPNNSLDWSIFDDILKFDINLNREFCIYVFLILTIATAVVTLVRTFLLYGMCINASMTLHDNMFTSITRATMKFFNDNTVGRILNRFSKDLGSIDELLPVAIIDCISIALTLIGIVAIVAFVNFWLLVPTFLITLLFYYMRKFYLITSRSIKRLEGVTRSPVFSHLSASLQGLATIRAFKAERILTEEFDRHKDLHTSAWYMFLVSNHAFGFWLDFICLVYISLVTFSFLVIDTGVRGGSVGLAITQSLALTGMFQWFMRQTAELENFMTSVERILEYTNLESEKPLESPPDKIPPKLWPSEGKVIFSHVYLYYNADDPPVLKNLSFTIEPGEKVGIVGRTGAGKSSLISALFRLMDLRGEIFIDDIATSSIGLHELRSKISIIPQEPVLFSGTMRKNLDPFDEFSDDVLWSTLEEVELKEAVNDLPGGLNSKMSEGGSNFSVGQRQLVCLARAIVRNNKILVLDEATANVDPQTDTLIQSTIRRKFADCTMLTIAHRLHTIMDSDKVLVMDSGILVEFNHPYLLLQKEDGHFYKMVENTGKTTSEMLYKIAANNYKKYIDDD